MTTDHTTPDPLAILAGIERREALARATLARYTWSSDDEAWDEGGPMGLAEYAAQQGAGWHLAVLTAARAELVDAVAQQKRHVPKADGSWCGYCNKRRNRCQDAQQAARTLARLAALYGGAA